MAVLQLHVSGLSVISRVQIKFCTVSMLVCAGACVCASTRLD